MKQIKPDPWTDITAKYPVGSKHTGTVRNYTNFGVFVELEEGIDGWFTFRTCRDEKN